MPALAPAAVCPRQPAGCCQVLAERWTAPRAARGGRRCLRAPQRASACWAALPTPVWQWRDASAANQHAWMDASCQQAESAITSSWVGRVGRALRKRPSGASGARTAGRQQRSSHSRLGPSPHPCQPSHGAVPRAQPPRGSGTAGPPPVPAGVALRGWRAHARAPSASSQTLAMHATSGASPPHPSLPASVADGSGRRCRGALPAPAALAARLRAGQQRAALPRAGASNAWRAAMMMFGGTKRTETNDSQRCRTPAVCKPAKKLTATDASGDMQVDSPPTMRMSYRKLALRRPRLTQQETPGI
jgi:hypothetical protein